MEDHTVDDTIERYVFDRPVGGYWSIRASVYTDCDRIQAYFEPLDISTAMVSPQPVIPQYDLPPYYDSSSPAYIAYQLVNRNENGEPLALDPVYPLNLSVQIHKLPNGTPETLNLVYDFNAKTFRSENPILVNEVGTYEFTTTATVRYVDSRNTEPRVLFVDGPRTYEVQQVDPFTFSITAPGSNEKMILHGGFPRFSIQPVVIYVQVTKRGGGGIDPALIFPNISSAFTGKITDLGGTTITTLNFTPNPAKLGDFIAQTNQLTAAGNYKITANVGIYYPQYHPDQSTSGIDFSMVDTLLTNPKTYKFAGVGLGILFLIGILIIILN